MSSGDGCTNRVSRDPMTSILNRSRSALIVGAGFAGAVHARELAERGYAVDVLDCRPHIGGNAYDELSVDGTRVHRYGPHLLHTNNESVMAWLERFGSFMPYVHRVLAELADGCHVPLPVNRTTINTVFSVNLKLETEVAAFLASVAEPCAQPRNAAEHLYSTIGRKLTDLFFRPYTKKMWDLDLEDMHESVVRRISIRTDDDDRYFPGDRFQVLPLHGYTAVFRNIFDHPNIQVVLGQRYDKGVESGYGVCFNSMPIDEYFDYGYGPLPYRSIRFHHRSVGSSYSRAPTSVVNFTDTACWTRETDWAKLPGHQEVNGKTKTVTTEEPCDYRDNQMERYYPVRTSDDRFILVYRQYRVLADRNPRMYFIGRCGTYQYLDMHQVISQSINNVRRWLREQGDT